MEAYIKELIPHCNVDLNSILNEHFEFSTVRIYGLKREGVNCLREVFEIFLKFNKILYMNPEQKSG